MPELRRRIRAEEAEYLSHAITDEERKARLAEERSSAEESYAQGEAMFFG